MYVSRRFGWKEWLTDYVTADEMNIEDRKFRQWIRIRGKISETGGHQAHLSAFAYMSDSYFIGTVARLHKIPRFSSPTALQRALKALKNPSDLDSEALSRYLEELAEEEAAEIRASSLNGTLTTNKLSSIIKRKDNREIGMMVSLDHTIYFHNPQALKADDWLLASIDSPWAGEGRGLVTQKVWNRDGVHVATCVQEVSSFFVHANCMGLFLKDLANFLLPGCCPTKTRRRTSSRSEAMNFYIAGDLLMRFDHHNGKTTSSRR